MDAALSADAGFFPHVGETLLERGVLQDAAPGRWGRALAPHLNYFTL